MTTRPAGARLPAIEAPAPNSTMATMAANDQPSARRKRSCPNTIMAPPPSFRRNSTCKDCDREYPRSGPHPRGGPFGEPADQELDQRGYLRRPRPSGRRYDIERDRRRGPVAHDRFEKPRPNIAPDHELRLNGHSQT